MTTVAARLSGDSGYELLADELSDPECGELAYRLV
jgi:hypothetical protein